ncbi:MAG: hypothetical protein FWG80_00435 [Alphaproteobacteria bacterium]|nr:hypothetical protein [Alphaproteobacteria bacterium]
MMKVNIKSFIENDEIVKSAEIGGAIYYFKFPKSVADDMTDRADPLIMALVFPMMRIGGNFEIHGAKFSREFADNIKLFTKIWNLWKPEQYKSVNITGDEIKNEKFNNDGKLITCFSGGLDATYTAYKYAKKLATGKNYFYDKSVFIHGADIPLNQPDKYKAALNSAMETTRDIGVDLVRVETNYREFPHDWEMEHGAIMAATLMFFQGGYSFGCATNQHIHRFQIIWGLNPFTDNLMSSDVFHFFNDGYEHNRCDRAGLIKDWDIGVKNLRVCWSNYNDLSKNCGYCEKCVRTKLNFLAHGISHLPSMPDGLTPAQIKEQKLDKDYKWKMYKECYKTGVINGTFPSDIKRTLEKKLSKPPHAHSCSLWQHLRKLKF